MPVTVEHIQIQHPRSRCTGCREWSLSAGWPGGTGELTSRYFFVWILHDFEYIIQLGGCSLNTNRIKFLLYFRWEIEVLMFSSLDPSGLPCCNPCIPEVLTSDSGDQWSRELEEFQRSFYCLLKLILFCILQTSSHYYSFVHSILVMTFPCFLITRLDVHCYIPVS